MKFVLKNEWRVNIIYVGIFIYALILYALLWRIPLLNIGVLGIPTQELGYTDQNFYIYWSEVICHYRNIDSSDFIVTWSSSGIVGYLTYTCRFFGTNEVFPIINTALFILFVYFYRLILKYNSQTIEASPRKIFFLPYSIYLFTLPGKEIFSFLSIMLAIMALIVNTNKKYIQSISLLMFSILISLISRPHEAALITFIVIFIAITMRQKTIINIFVFIALFYITDYILIEKILKALSFNITRLQDQFSYVGDYDKLIISNNILIHSILFPIRVIVVLFGVFFNSFNNLFISNNEGWYFIFRDITILIRAIDITAFLMALLYLLKIKEKNIKKILLRFFIFYMFFIVLAGVDQKSRYIFAVLPPIVLLRMRVNN